MAIVKRGRFQGIRNIIRFNWHFYLLSILLIAALLILQLYIHAPWSGITLAIAFISFFLMMLSLMVSLYVYDLSDLYSMAWLDDFKLPPYASMVNIHAGFDETSALLTAQFPNASLTVLDFYNPEKHTEVSIKRARKAYPSFPGTIAVETVHLPLPPKTVDVAFCLLAVHELRDVHERTHFFKEVKRTLKPGGRIVFIEHLRDISNFIAYTIGFLHFYSRGTWERHFKDAELIINKEFTITPFITGYILQNGTAP